MGILKPHERVDYDKIREQIAQEEELENLWRTVPITTDDTDTTEDTDEIWWYSSDAGVYTDLYNPDGSKKEPIRSIREREHKQMNAQVASSRRDAIRSNSWNRSACQRKQTRCTNQRGRR